jgi:hypothetical protein
MRLPRPDDLGVPEATVAVPVDTGGLTLYRLVEHVTPTTRDFEPAFSCNQARLRGLPELFRTSVSHWLAEAQAVAASARETCFVARVELGPPGRMRVALTDEWGAGHVDVWGHPDELLGAVAGVERRRKL